MTRKRCENPFIEIFGLKIISILFVISPFWMATALPVKNCSPQFMNVDKESCAGCFWMDPCGLPPIQTESNITEEALKIKDSTTFILNHINSYADHFCNESFNEKFEAMVVRDALISYDWIYNGSAPKNIGERLNLTHYQSLEFQKLLLHAADTLRRAAVGYKFIDSEEDPFYCEFLRTKENLQNLLCKIETSSINLNMQLQEHPTEEIMSSELRDPQLERLQKNLRNFRILKALVNLLEYFADGFSYFSHFPNFNVNPSNFLNLPESTPYLKVNLLQ